MGSPHIGADINIVSTKQACMYVRHTHHPDVIDAMANLSHELGGTKACVVGNTYVGKITREVGAASSW
jgi:hypothetical protein